MNALHRESFNEASRRLARSEDAAATRDEALPTSISPNERELRADLARDIFYNHIAAKALASASLEFLAVYFRSTDTAQHLFWKYYEPRFFPSVTPAQARRYANVIPATYELMDHFVGQLRASLGDEWAVVILSDHGAGLWPEARSRRSLFRSYHPTYSGKHRVLGVVAMRGPGIKRGFRISGASVYDVTPTILCLAGLSPAADMRGKVLGEALAAVQRRACQEAVVPTYGWRLDKRDGRSRQRVDSETIRRLRALGYVN